MRDPSATVAKRLKEVRARRGWSAQRLAQECAHQGMSQLNRAVIANIESGRRKQGITLEELFTLALVLNVAPVHLMVDTADDATALVQVGMHAVGPQLARQWIRGDMPVGATTDPRVYFSEVPESEWDRPKPSAEDIETAGRQAAAVQELQAKVRGFDTEPPAEGE